MGLDPPYFENKITLDNHRKDPGDLPLVKIDFEYHEMKKP